MKRSFLLLVLSGSIAFTCLSLTTAAQNQEHLTAVELVQRFKAMNNPALQADVAKAMITLHDPSVLSGLEPYLTDQNRMVRGNAALVFAGLGDNRGFQIILDILNDKSTNGRQIRPSSINPVRQDRYYAAHLLGDLKDPRAVPILIPLLRDPEVNYVVPWSLAQIGDKSAIPALIESLTEKNPDMRVLAIDALQRMKAKQALPQIRDLVSDDERIHFDGLGTVGEAARKAVAELGSD